MTLEGSAEYIPLRLDTLPCSDEEDRAMAIDEEEGVSRAEEGSDVGLWRWLWL